MSLTPEQVADKWQLLRPAIRQSVPPQVAVSDKAVKNILKNLLLGNGTVWIYFNEDQSEAYGMVVTKPEYDELSETGSLLIYSAFSFGGLTLEMMKEALKTLLKHADAEGLGGVIAYSKNKELIRFLEERGASVEYSLIELNF